MLSPLVSVSVGVHSGLIYLFIHWKRTVFEVSGEVSRCGKDVAALKFSLCVVPLVVWRRRRRRRRRPSSLITVLLVLTFLLFDSPPSPRNWAIKIGATLVGAFVIVQVLARALGGSKK